MSDFIVRTFGATQVAPVRIQHNTTYRRKNGTFTSERTLTRGSSASDRHAEDAPWISSPFIRSVHPHARAPLERALDAWEGGEHDSDTDAECTPVDRMLADIEEACPVEWHNLRDASDADSISAHI